MNDLTLMAWESDAQFCSLSDDGRRKVRDRVRICERILKHEGRRGDIVAREAKTLGVGGSTIRLWISKYEQSGGDWRSQIDYRAEKHETHALPPDFVDFFKLLCEENQRSSRRAHKKMVALWRSHAATYQYDKDSAVHELWPGYTDDRGFPYRPEAEASTGLPRGWSYRNLVRLQPNKLERTLTRLGPIAASEYQQMVFTTRKNLRPGQFYVFDDRWLDLKCITQGMNKPVRVIELSAGDVFSGKTVSWDLFPLEEIIDDAGRAKREQITKVHMLLLLVDLLCFKGFDRGGVTLMVEHGTAAISHELEMLLCRLSGGATEEVIEDGKTVQRIVKHGLIRVDRSGIKGGVSFAGGFPTLGKGNFRFKAGLESTHSLKHNASADLPGQVGKDSKKQPFEFDHGLEAHARRMIEAALSHRMEVLQAVKENTGYLTERQLYWAVLEVFKKIHADPDHKLEGWIEAGLERAEYRLKQEEDAWLPQGELDGYPDEQRAAILAFIGKTPWATRRQRLSRDEAWKKNQDLVRLPVHCAVQILGEHFAKLRPDLCREREVTDKNFIHVQVQAIGEDPMFFSSICERPDGVKHKLTPGERYRTVISPLNAKTLFVSDLSGRYIGTCKFERIDKGDSEATVREFGRVAFENKLLTEDSVRRTRLRNRRLTAQLKRSNELFAGGPATEAERQLAADREARRAQAQSVEALTQTVTPTQAPPLPSPTSDEAPPVFSAFQSPAE